MTSALRTMSKVAASPSPLLFGILVLAFLSRLPLIANGYGSDPDAWRVAYVAHRVWSGEGYVVSRFPGYPLYELVSVLPVALGGSTASNLATLLAGLAAVAVFHRIAHRHARHPALLTFLFAFAPLFWVLSATTMDYVWSLLFVLLSFHSGLRGRAIPAGIFAGLATGFRPSNAVAAAAVVVLLYFNGTNPRRAIAVMCAAAAGAVAVSFLPVLSTYGLSGWIHGITGQVGGFHGSLADRVLFASYRAVYAIGPAGVIAAGLVTVQQRRKLLSRLRDRSPLLTASLIAVVCYLVVFFLLPMERAYLLPVIPFLLLMLDALGTRRALFLTGACMLSYAFINPDLVTHTRYRGVAQPAIREGIVPEEIAKRRGALARRDYLAAHPPPGRAIIMTGVGPIFWLENPRVERVPEDAVGDPPDAKVRATTRADLLFVPMLTRDDLERERSGGFGVWCVSDLQEYIETSVHYRMEEAGVEILPIPQF